MSAYLNLSSTTSAGEDSSVYKSQAKRLETFSSRYALPTNDPALIAKLPFTFGYRFTDDYGTMQAREEKTDPNGAKTGSYSFVDAQGTYRRVDYIADRHGFRATVRTNEPGILSADPAHVSVFNEQEKNSEIPQQPPIRNLPEVDYSSHIFSRYNESSTYGQGRNNFADTYGNGNAPNQKPFLDGFANFGRDTPGEPIPQSDPSFAKNFANFGGNAPRLQLPQRDPSFVKNFANFGGNAPREPIPQNEPGIVKNINYYKGSPFPERAPLRTKPSPALNINQPIRYPDPNEFNVDKFFNSPNVNSEFIFRDKVSNQNHNNRPQYPLIGQQYATPTRYPRRLRDSRMRGRQKDREYKIHTPRGYENYPNLPLYRDK